MRTATLLATLSAAALGALGLAAGPAPVAPPPAPKPAQNPAVDPAFEKEIRPLLQQYCVGCHGPDEMKSGVRVDLLDDTFPDKHIALWKDLAGQVEDGDMPPPNKPQPSAAQKERLLAWIDGKIKQAQARETARHGWSRRLTVAQYRNTLRDLLGLEDDLAKLLPADGISAEGFSNDGATLQLSPLQMEAYMEIADKALDLCLVDPAKPPEIQRFRVDLGQNINPAPSKERLELGAGNHLLANADLRVTELDPGKPFPAKMVRMRQEYDFIEGYAGNATVRGMRHFKGLEHVVYGCMRGTEGYPLGLAYDTVPGALLLRPAIPSNELFGQGNTMGPQANFKISVRELPDAGRFRIKVKASRFERDGLLLKPDIQPPADAVTTILPLTDGRAAATLAEGGVYQVDLANEATGKGGNVELRINGRSYAFPVRAGGKDDDQTIALRDKLKGLRFDSLKITIPGNDRILHLHELKLLAGGKNIAPEATLSRSSVYAADGKFEVGNLVDGKLDNLAHTAEEDHPWFRLDFKTPQQVEALEALNRKGFESRLDGAVAVFSLQGKEVASLPLVPDDQLREDAVMLLRLDKGPLAIEAIADPRQVKLNRIELHRMPAGGKPAADYAAFEKRTPQLGVALGFRRDCGSTLPLVGEPQAVASGQPQEYVFTGAIANYPAPVVEKDNLNYLAGLHEIGVRSEYTDGRPMPRLCVHSVEFEGPFHDVWPPRTHAGIFIPSAAAGDPPRYAGEILDAFMARAYRRPPVAAESALVRKVFTDAFRERKDFRAAVKDALMVVLTSPQFLFITEESKSPAAEDLAPHELAAKLSYFLWNTMPDERLLAAAKDGSLRRDLPGTVDRMLADPRSGAFYDAFVPEWLQLGRFDTVEVSLKQFPKMTPAVRRQLRREPVEFVRHLVGQNLPVRNLVASDFIVANDAVATFYGLGDQSENGLAFGPVPVGASGRGGLLTQTGILCAQSSGKESNPVKRGAWLARKIVAEPPPPPPPNVPEVAENDGSPLTLRQKLERHRNQPGCVKCHTRIDPWGVPLEEFDAIGTRKPKVDAASELPDGTEVAGFDALRAYLADDRRDAVAYAFMKHLATYALGRNLNHFEQEKLKADCKALAPAGYKARDMVKWLVQSDLFLKK